MSDGLPSWYDHWRIGDAGRRLSRHQSECSDCDGSGVGEGDLDDCPTCDGSGVIENEPDVD